MLEIKGVGITVFEEGEEAIDKCEARGTSRGLQPCIHIPWESTEFAMP